MNAKRNIEIMAPAGSWESLQAALQGGANSIYFGVEQLNMRARASNNFTFEDLVKISKEGIKCAINDFDYQGSDVVLSLQLGDQEIYASIDSKKVDGLDNHVCINWDNKDLHFFDFESGVRDVD